MHKLRAAHGVLVGSFIVVIVIEDSRCASEILAL